MVRNQRKNTVKNHKALSLPVVLPSLLGSALLVNPVGAQLEPTELDPKTEAIKSGTVIWEFEKEGAVYSSPVIGTDGTVYIPFSSLGGIGRHGKIFALDGKTGDIRWESSYVGINSTSSIAIGKGEVPKIVVGFKQLEERDVFWYLKGKPFRGVVVWKSGNGQKKWERTFKDG